MEERTKPFKLVVKRERYCYVIFTKQGHRIAEILVPSDRQLIRDSTMLKEIMTVLEWRYGLRKEKYTGTKGNYHDLFYYQCGINGYCIYKGVPEDGGAITVGRIMTPADYRYEKDEILLSEILKILDKRLYWK